MMIDSDGNVIQDTPVWFCVLPIECVDCEFYKRKHELNCQNINKENK